jgi:hypothetical protein
MEKFMPFAIDIRQWKTVEEFANHLKAHNPNIVPWAQGVVLHHTWRPLQNQWKGRTSIEGLKAFYEQKTPPWDAGPHLFICSGAPNPQDDGIWQMTPLNMIGVHAGSCNSHYWGIEVVGDYDKAPWDEKTKNLVVGATGELLKWISASCNNGTVIGHRNCGSNKTCPGSAINLDNVRSWVNAYLSHIPEKELVTPQSALLSKPRCSIEQAAKYILSRSPKPSYTAEDITLSILPAYWKICEAVNLDPCVVIAQIIHETGNFSSWWIQRPRRNPAGVGVTGESRTTQPVPEDINKWAWNSESNYWLKGLSFTNWIEAATAHTGRLVAYATKPSERNTQQVSLVNQALSYRTLLLSLQGTAPTLEGLNGKWAYPGTTYAQKITEIANQIIAVNV